MSVELGIGRHTWLNTLLGMLDAAFWLTDEELFFARGAICDLLDHLNIPERGSPAELPAAVALEAASQIYSAGMLDTRNAGVTRNARLAHERDVRVTLEAWRQALLTLLTVAYPDLDPIEIVAATKIFDDILLGLGVPERGAAFLPDNVVRAHLQGA